MQNDNGRQESGRIRRIPIHIEDADHTDYYQQKERSTANHHNNHSNHNTSSVNINYVPPSPNRDSPSPAYQPHSQHHQHLHQTSSRNQPPAGRDTELNSSNTRAAAGSPEPESKLINSPEPIPLPPPSSMRNESPQNNNSAKSNNNQTTLEQTNESKTLAAINSIKMEVVSLVNQISLFSGTSAKSKEFRYLEEMLTQCNLKLDNIVCGEDLNMRQQRKAAVKMIDQATDILMKKLQINIDIHNLSQSMTQSS